MAHVAASCRGRGAHAEVLAPPNAVNNMLRADWALFLERQCLRSTASPMVLSTVAASHMEGEHQGPKTHSGAKVGGDRRLRFGGKCRVSRSGVRLSDNPHIKPMIRFGRNFGRNHLVEVSSQIGEHHVTLSRSLPKCGWPCPDLGRNDPRFGRSPPSIGRPRSKFGRTPRRPAQRRKHKTCVRLGAEVSAAPRSESGRAIGNICATAPEYPRDGYEAPPQPHAAPQRHCPLQECCSTERGAWPAGSARDR